MFFLVCTALIILPVISCGEIVVHKDDVKMRYNMTSAKRCQGVKHRIQAYSPVSISDCVTRCALRQHCLALNYYGAMEFCELMADDDDEFSDRTCTYVRQYDIHIQKSPCGRKCEWGKTCDISTKLCVIKECVDLPTIQNGKILGNGRSVGSRLIVKCYPNFAPSAGKTWIYCTRKGIWDPVIECQSTIKCEDLPSPPNDALVKSDNGNTAGSVTKYECKAGFVDVETTLKRECLSNGTWSGKEPKCLPVFCTENACYAKYVDLILMEWGVDGIDLDTADSCIAYCEGHANISSVVFSPGHPLVTNSCFCTAVSVTIDTLFMSHEDCYTFAKVTEK